MTNEKLDALTAARLREKAIARWENEGGAPARGKRGQVHFPCATPKDPPGIEPEAGPEGRFRAAGYGPKLNDARTDGA